MQIKTVAEDMADRIQGAIDIFQKSVTKAHIYDPLGMELNKLEQPEGTTMWASHCYGQMALYVTGDRTRLEEVWRVLRKHGFDTKEFVPAIFKDSEFSNTWNHESGAIIGLSWTSTVCRRVKVGTKMVEQDVYEIQCGEPEPAHDLTAPEEPPAEGEAV